MASGTDRLDVELIRPDVTAGMIVFVAILPDEDIVSAIETGEGVGMGNDPALYEIVNAPPGLPAVIVSSWLDPASALTSKL